MTTPTFVGLNRLELVDAIASAELNKESFTKRELIVETNISEDFFIFFTQITAINLAKFTSQTVLFWNNIPDSCDHLDPIINSTIIKLLTKVKKKDLESIQVLLSDYSKNGKSLYKLLRSLLKSVNTDEKNLLESEIIKAIQKV